MNKVELFTKQYTKKNIPQLRSGDTIRVHERIKEGDKERIQVFEGLVIATKHGTKGPNATFTVRKISAHRVGVEKTFPLHSPIIQKIEVVKHDKVRRAKLYYVRDLIGKKRKRKAAKMLGVVYEEPESETGDTDVDEQAEEKSKTEEKAKSQNDQVSITPPSSEASEGRGNDQASSNDQSSKNKKKAGEKKSEEKKIEEKKE